MESRKMVLTHLFTGKQWRNRHREQTYGHGDRGRDGEMEKKDGLPKVMPTVKHPKFRIIGVPEEDEMKKHEKN